MDRFHKKRFSGIIKTVDTMDKKSKMFLGILAFAAMVSIVAVYYRYLIAQDFDFYTDEEAFNESLLEE